MIINFHFLQDSLLEHDDLISCKTPVTPGHVPTTLALRPKKIRGRSKNL